MRSLIALVSLALVPVSASAHPDHLDGSSGGFLHLVRDPFHLSLIAAAVGLAWAARLGLTRLQRARERSD